MFATDFDIAILFLFPVRKFLVIIDPGHDLDHLICPLISLGTTVEGIAVVAAREETEIVIAAAAGTTGAKTVATVDHNGAVIVTVTAAICPRVNDAGHHLETVIEKGHARPGAIVTAECHPRVALRLKGRVVVKGELLSARRSRKEARMMTGVKQNG